MFYWSHKGIHVVLSDAEEMALVRELAEGPVECVKYLISRSTRRDIERRIFRHFAQCLRADPEAFRRRYVFRSCYGNDAQRMLPVLLDAYGRITRRAIVGSHGGRSHLDEIVESTHYVTGDAMFQITLLEKGRRLWARPRVSGHISLPVSSIERVAGTADNFFVASSSVVIKFHRDFVRISILETSDVASDNVETDKE